MLREVQRAVGWHRRLFASGLLAGAVALGLSALEPAAPTTVRVVTAARELGGGATLTADALQITHLPPAAVPEGAARHPERLVGRVLAAPLREGETVTDIRLVGASLLTSYGDNLVATPVRIADGASVALLQPGDVIDVLAAAAPEVAGSAQALAEVVASSVPILTLPSPPSDAFGESDESGALIVIAATPQTATRLASAAVTSRLSLTIRSVD